MTDKPQASIDALYGYEAGLANGLDKNKARIEELEEKCEYLTSIKEGIDSECEECWEHTGKLKAYIEELEAAGAIALEWRDAYFRRGTTEALEPLRAALNKTRIG